MEKREIEKRLLKKWRGIVTRYTNYKNDGWKHIYTRGMTTVTVDLSKNISYYETLIDNGKKIIESITNQQSETSNQPSLPDTD